jgi:hypothetical protein
VPWDALWRRSSKTEEERALGRYVPRDFCAKIVTDKVDARLDGRVDQSGRIGHQLVEAVLPEWSGSCAWGVTPLVQCQDTMACGRESIHRGKPSLDVLGKTVQQHDRFRIRLTTLQVLELHVIVDECVQILLEYIGH